MQPKSCVRKEVFVNKLRELGYSFKEQKKRIDLYRRNNPVHYVSIPRCDLLSEAFVQSALRQAGLTEDEIQEFIAAVRVFS